jgi:hypothetical protein
VSTLPAPNWRCATSVPEYDPNSQVVPWTVKLPGAVDPVSNWRKTVRPSASDYKPFRDEAYWIRYNERFVSTINPMDSNISSTLTLRRQDAALDQLNVAGSDSTDIMQAPPAKKLSSSVI